MLENVPEGQGRQDDAPELENVPAGHFVQLFLSLALENVPVKHGSQIADELPEGAVANFPEGHELQDEGFVDVEYVPHGHAH